MNHAREFQQTLRVIERDAWPEVEAKLSDEVVTLLCLYRTHYIEVQELEHKVAYGDDQEYHEYQLRKHQEQRDRYLEELLKKID